MRGFAILLAAVGICSPTLVAQLVAVAHDAPTLELSISTDKKTFAPGDEIPIHVRLKNVSEDDVFIGRYLSSIGSPSYLTISIRNLAGRPMSGYGLATDGFPSDVPLTQLPRKAMQWALLLPRGYPYGYDTSAKNFVQQSDLTPGEYAISAVFTSFGIEAKDYTSPFLGHPDVIATFKNENWKGKIDSNELRLRIALPHKSAHPKAFPR
jgi:hypothetical protein